MRPTHPTDTPAKRSERLPALVDLPESAALARGAFDADDYRDAYRITLSPEMPTDPRYWAQAIFFRRPFPELAHSSAPAEVLIGDSLKSLDFRASILVQDRALTMSTVVRFRGAAGARYFAVVKPFHRCLVRGMLWLAVRRARAR